MAQVDPRGLSQELGWSVRLRQKLRAWMLRSSKSASRAPKTGSGASKMDERCGATNGAGSRNEPMPGWACSVDCRFVMSTRSRPPCALF